MILREEASGSKKRGPVSGADGGQGGQLQITARINDQEAVKNLVAQGLGVSIISERAARNFCEEKRVLLFELPEDAARRSLYLISHKSYSLQPYIQKFTEYVKHFWTRTGNGPRGPDRTAAAGAPPAAELPAPIGSHQPAPAHRRRRAWRLGNRRPPGLPHRISGMRS